MRGSLLKNGGVDMKKNYNIAKIISLYQEGYSQKDIASMFKIQVYDLRELLKENGFDTKTYRKVAGHKKELVAQLIQHGFSYSEIANTLDISYHLIREIAKARNVMGGSLVYMKIAIPKPDIDKELFHSFLEEYEAGTCGFIKLMEKYFVEESNPAYPIDVALYLCQYINEQNLVAVHHKNIYSVIHQRLSEGIEPNVIAKQMEISFSLVKRYKNKHFCNSQS